MSLTNSITDSKCKKTLLKINLKFSRNSPLYLRQSVSIAWLLPSAAAAAAAASAASKYSSDDSSDTNLFHESEVVHWAAKPALFANEVCILVVNPFDIFVYFAQFTKLAYARISITLLNWKENKMCQKATARKLQLFY